MIYLKSFPAKNGDAFLVKTDGPDPVAILIDGGYPATFQKYIRSDLVDLAAAGYRLNLVVATHVDADHVSGLLPFFEANGDSRAPKIIPVSRVFHNSLRSLNHVPTNSGPRNATDEDLLSEIQRRGYPLVAAEAQADVEISARQGSSLAALLKSGAYSWNSDDGKQSIHGDGLPSFQIGSDAKVTVIGPPLIRLEKLLAWWTSEIRRLGYVGVLDSNDRLDDAFELLCADAEPVAHSHPISGHDSSNLELKDCYLPDDSITNASSISLIIQVADSRLLLLGDSWAEDTEAALRKLAPPPEPLIFEAIKVSHHGSLRNTSPAVLDLIDAPRFFVSSSGEGHDHPDFTVLKAIVDRPSASCRELLFNYPTAASQRLKSHVSKSGAPFVVREGATDWIPLGKPVRP